MGHIAFLELKVKVRGQCQTSKVEVKDRNAVGGTSVLIEDSFLVV